MTFSPALVEIAGWIPAIILPLAALIQLVEILRKRSAGGVSWLSWGLFGLANVLLFIHAEKYDSVQLILGMLGTAVVDFIIMGLALVGYGRAATEGGA